MKTVLPLVACYQWMHSEDGTAFLFKHTFWIKVCPTDHLSQASVFFHLLSQGSSKNEIHDRELVEGLPWKYQQIPSHASPALDLTWIEWLQTIFWELP